MGRCSGTHIFMILARRERRLPLYSSVLPIHRDVCKLCAGDLLQRLYTELHLKPDLSAADYDIVYISAEISMTVGNGFFMPTGEHSPFI